MNNSLKNFIYGTFKTPAKALDLGAGDFSDVIGLKQLGWECQGVDIKTGVDLENSFLSKDGPFDLVYSNYVLHKLTNKKQLIQTIYNNLADDGWLFIHTFDAADSNSKSDLSPASLRKLLTDQGFKSINIKLFDYFDDSMGHKHWHKILEATGQK